MPALIRDSAMGLSSASRSVAIDSASLTLQSIEVLPYALDLGAFASNKIRFQVGIDPGHQVQHHLGDLEVLRRVGDISI